MLRVFTVCVNQTGILSKILRSILFSSCMSALQCRIMDHDPWSVIPGMK